MRSVTLKSAMTPSFIGLIATMLPGVRPSISLASFPTASTRPLILLIATIDGSLTTIPLPRAYTQVLAVPRSIARSLEKSESIERRLIGGAVVGCQESKKCEVVGRPGLRLPAAGHVRHTSIIGWSRSDLNPVLAGLFHAV